MWYFREGKNSEDEKENEADNASVNKQDQSERKRKLSESSSKIASNNKKANSINVSDECHDRSVDDKIKSDHLLNNPAKIKIAVKPKKNKIPAANETPNTGSSDQNTTKEDEESDIFDDIDVSKMDVDQEEPSSRSTSPNDCIIEEPACSINTVPSNDKSEKLDSGKKSKNKINSFLPNTPKSYSGCKEISYKSTCSPAVLEERKHRMKVEIAKLIVKINENKDALEKSVERQEFLLAQELKTTIATLETEKMTLVSVLEREDAVELKCELDDRYRSLSATKLFSPQPSVSTCDHEGNTEVTKSIQDSNSESTKKDCNDTSKTLPKKISSKQLLSKEERAKLKEEEKKFKELQKKKKEEIKEKERNERNAQKEKEKKEKEEQKENERKEREEQKERERKDKEQQKERERIEKLEQKQKERMEKERIKLAKEEERVKKQLEKELEKEEQKKEKELEKLKREEEKEKARKEKEEKERLEKIEKEKEELKYIKPITSFFTKKTQDAQSTVNSHVAAPRAAGCDQILSGTNVSPHLIDGKVRSSHLSQFLIKKNMRIAPVLRASIVHESRDKLDNILKRSQWEETQNTYLNLLRSKRYIASTCGHTWPVQDRTKSQESTECDNECEPQENDEEDAEDQTVKSLLELDQSKIIEIDIPDDDIESDRKVMSKTSNGICEGKANQMFCKTRAKLLQFHENERPAYWGTWSKKSNVVGPRRPFAKDCHFLEYDYDSDDDWEEEEEGESLSDEEKDKEEEQDMKEEEEDDDGFFVGHGVLDKEEAHLIDSEEEDNNSAELVKQERASAEKDNNQLEEDLEVQKMKMRAEQFEEAYKKQKRMPTKLKPRVFGCFWKLDFEQNSAIAENNNKDRIVHDQLMKILKPYGSVVMLTDSIDENPNESATPIDTSHTINIRVRTCYSFRNFHQEKLKFDNAVNIFRI